MTNLEVYYERSEWCDHIGGKPDPFSAHGCQLRAVSPRAP